MGRQDPSIDATRARTGFLLLQTLPAALTLKGFLHKAHLKGAGAQFRVFPVLAPCKAQEGGILRARSVTKEVRLLGFTVRTAGAKSVELLSGLSRLGPQTCYTAPSVNKQRASPSAQWVKNPPAKAGDTRDQETQVQSLDWEDPLEEEMATHSSILAWEIPWTEEPGGLGVAKSGHD